MSIPLCVFYCSNCDFEESLHIGSTSHVYEKNNGKTVLAPTCFGWCLTCNKVTFLLTGLNPAVLKEEIRRNEEIILNEINKRNVLNLGLSEYEKKVKNELAEKISRNKDFLSILNNKVSVNYCLSCNSTDVFPLDLKPDTFSLPEITTYTHLNCGGQLKTKWSELRFSYNIQKKTVKPLFLHKDQKKKDKNEINNIHGWVEFNKETLTNTKEFNHESLFFALMNNLSTFIIEDQDQKSIFTEKYHNDYVIFEVGCYLLFRMDVWLTVEKPNDRLQLSKSLFNQYIKLFSSLHAGVDFALIFNNRLSHYSEFIRNGEKLERYHTHLVFLIMNTADDGNLKVFCNSDDVPFKLTSITERAELQNTVILYEEHSLPDAFNALEKYFAS